MSKQCIVLEITLKNVTANSQQQKTLNIHPNWVRYVLVKLKGVKHRQYLKRFKVAYKLIDGEICGTLLENHLIRSTMPANYNFIDILYSLLLLPTLTTTKISELFLFFCCFIMSAS